MRRFGIWAAVCAAFCVALFYGLPQWLRAGQIEAAAADVRRLEAAAPPPEAGRRNVFAALWLLPYDIPAAEHAAVMHRYGATLHHSRHMQDDLAGRRLPAAAGERPDCLQNSVAECIAQIEADSAPVAGRLAGREKLLAHIDALADYDTFHHPYWPDGRSGVELILPELSPLTQEAVLSTLLVWRQQGTAAGLRQACRQMKTGRLLLQGRPGLIFPMAGSAMLRRHIDVAAHILAEQPQPAGQMPAECADAFAPLPAEALSLCRALGDEFLLGRQSLHNLFAAAENHAPWRWLEAWQWDEAHSAARMAEHYAPPCRSTAADLLARDEVWPAMPPAPNSWAQRWACIGNAAGCALTSDDLRVDFADYIRRMQDTQMRLQAMRALLALYRLPPEGRSGADIAQVLAAHATPQRSLRLSGRQLHFPLYAPRHDQERYPPLLPVAAGFALR